MSGNLKNLMGVNDSASNQFFHAGSGAKGEYDDIPFLAQCVADLNTLRKPDLCVADATEFLLTNGPQGPGELRKLGKVILGTDPVAVDAYGAPLVNLKAADVLMITKSVEWGLGRMDVAKLAVEQLTVYPVGPGPVSPGRPGSTLRRGFVGVEAKTSTLGGPSAFVSVTVSWPARDRIRRRRRSTSRRTADGGGHGDQ